MHVVPSGFVQTKSSGGFTNTLKRTAFTPFSFNNSKASLVFPLSSTHCTPCASNYDKKPISAPYIISSDDPLAACTLPTGIIVNTLAQKQNVSTNAT